MIANEMVLAPSEAFIADVRDALEHVSNVRVLSRHPLATRLGYACTPIEAGQALRRELLSAITSLKSNGGGKPEYAARFNRMYQLLHLYYVNGMKLQHIAYRLGISLRQVYRDLKKACQEVGEWLWFTHQLTAETVASDTAMTCDSGCSFHPTPDFTPLVRQAMHALQIAQMQPDNLRKAVLVPAREGDAPVTYFLIVPI